MLKSFAAREWGKDPRQQIEMTIIHEAAIKIQLSGSFIMRTQCFGRESSENSAWVEAWGYTVVVQLIFQAQCSVME
jgi:hypothetical protein